MVQGIKQSSLLSDLYEENESKVPVGQNILTNTTGIRERLQPLTRGNPLTTLRAEQFDAIGSSRQGKAVKWDSEKGSVTFKDRDVLNDALIEDVAFEPEDGTLNIVRRNGELLQIRGFLVQSDFGVGPTGPRGAKGYDGHDGDSGDEGRDGEQGCEGPPGPLGLEGPMGEPGKDGLTGPTGPIGQEGATGLQGPPGDQGRYGHEGARGRPGPSCVGGGAGAKGPDGESVIPHVVISATEPEGNVVLWGIPVS